MKRLIPFLFLVLPVALFAQGTQAPRDRETAMLKGFGLNDSQVTQVFDIQDKTRTTARQDAAQLRLLRAQMDKALLPAAPNMQEVNGYITQMAQTRADLAKTFVGARVQLRQLIGDDNFPVYARYIMHRFGMGGRGGSGTGELRGGMMGRSGGMMGRDGPMMGRPNQDGGQAD
jgi:hypothetical protein